MKILHIADIQIEKDTRTNEFKNVLENMLNIIKVEKFDYVVCVGDIFQEYVCGHTNKEIISNFFHKASKYCKFVLITKGNHDLKQHTNTMLVNGQIVPQLDILDEMVSTMSNAKVKLLDKTDFYNFGDDIVWAVFDHKTKYHKYLNLPYSPYYDGFVKEPNKIYIDLFHDPVDGCIDFSEKEIRTNHSKNLNEFLGDFSLFGDIHCPQTFCNDTKGYCSSLVARNYGEGDYYINEKLVSEGNIKHGYNILDLSEQNPKLKFYPLFNDCAFHTITIGENFDYNNIKIILKNARSENYLKIKMTDNLSNYTHENSLKLMQYFQSKYNLVEYKVDLENMGIKPKNIKNQNNIEENFIDLSKSGQKILLNDYLNSIDILDKTMFENIEDEVLSLMPDEILNEKYSTKIKYVKIKNFKSIKNFEIDLEKINGLVLIRGLNESGKTSLTQAIQWCLTGKIPALDGSRQKYQELSIFNRQTTENEMYVEILREVNGQNETIFRSVELQYKKSVKFDKPMISKEDLEENLLATGGIKNLLKISKSNGIVLEKTDAIDWLKKTNGDYEDYIRLIETNGDTLNELINLDKKNELIEYILGIRGLGVYEIKKEYFKELKKSKLDGLDKLNIDPIKTKNEIDLLEEKKINFENEIQFILNEIYRINLELEKTNSEIHIEYEKIQNIDLNLISKFESATKRKHQISQNLFDLYSKLENYKNLLNSLKSQNNEYSNIDYEKVKILNLTKDNIVKNLHDIKMEIMQTKQICQNFENEIESIKRNYFEEISQKIKNIEIEENHKFETNKQNIEFQIREIISNSKNSKEKELNEFNAKLLQQKNEGSLLREKSKNIENQIKIIQQTIEQNEASKICQTCKRMHDDKSVQSIMENNKLLNLELTNLKNDLENIKSEINILVVHYKNSEDIFKNLQNNINVLSKEDNEKIQNFNTLLDAQIKYDQNYYDLKNIFQNRITLEIQPILIEKVKNLDENYSKLDNLNKDLSKINENLVDIDGQINIEQLKLENFEKQRVNFEKLSNQIIYEIPNEISNLENEQNLQNIVLGNIEIEKSKILQNNVYEAKIQILKNLVGNYSKDKTTQNENLNLVRENILKISIQIKNLNEKIEVFNQRQILENVLKVYEQSLGKNGIPLMIFRMEAQKINQKMQMFLGGLNFSVFFDINSKNCDLKMLDMLGNRNENYVYCGSGMQRTFAVMALIGALLTDSANKIFELNFRVFDEITGKLSNISSEKDMDKNNYQNLMIGLIQKFRKNFGIMFLIDHVLDEELLKPDCVINVSKVLDSNNNVYSKYDIKISK